MRNQYGFLIKTIDDLRGYDKEMVWQIVSRSERREWAKDEVIYQQNEIADSLFLIHDGRVKCVGKTGQKFMTYQSG
jgi:CRP-like cAMP-binding protein